MSLDRYYGTVPFFSPDNPDCIRSIMLSAGRQITVDLPISVMIFEFGESKLAHLEHFETQRKIIEIAASDAFDARSPIDNYLLIEKADFQTQASRSHRTKGDWF